MISKLRHSQFFAVLMAFMLLINSNAMITAQDVDPVASPEVTQEVTPPVVEEPVGDEPVIEEPVSTEPVYEEPAVIDEEPVLAPMNLDSQTEMIPLAEGVTEDKYWCNHANYQAWQAQGNAGSVATWRATAPTDADLDCFDIVVVTHECGILDMQFNNHLQGLTSNLYWTEGPNYVWNSRSTVYPITFPEDYNDGQVTVTVALSTPEKDYLTGAGEADLAYWSGNTNPNGVNFVIDTDCLPNIPTPEENPLYYCQNQPAVSDVATWLAEGAALGYESDCIDVGEVVQECGFIQIPITEEVANFDFWIEYVDLDGNTQILPAAGLNLPEDFNGGSVTYTFYIGGPEQDYVAFANEGGWQYPGTPITIDTDCLIPGPEEAPNYYCENLPARGSVADWLAEGAELGYNTDCINVDTPALQCGNLTIPYENLTSYESALYWNEGTTPNADTGQPLPATFAEDYNGGEVTITVWIGHPESDYYAFMGEADQAYTYANGGVTFTIDTDCLIPGPTETPVTPEPTETPVTPEPSETPVTPDPTETPVTPDPTETPVTPDPTDEPKTDDPKKDDDKDEAPVVSELPSTGSGSSSPALMGMAAAAAAAIAGAGIFVNNRKR